MSRRIAALVAMGIMFGIEGEIGSMLATTSDPAHELPARALARRAG
jgi:hypothetical protein